METMEYAQFALTGLVLAISVISAIYAAVISKKVTSSDYASSQRVKSETARLIAVLRSVVTKATYARLFKTKMDLSYERELINQFINSTTALAYYAWMGLKSEQAGVVAPEKWRLLFNHLSMLSRAEYPQKCVWLAVNVERMFNSLSEDDLSTIVGFNSDLRNAIANSKEGRGGDTLLEVVYQLVAGETAKTHETHEPPDHDLLIKQLQFLKEQAKVNDPNVDLFLAVLLGDTQGVSAAKERGADHNVPISALLQQYKAELGEFREGAHAP